MGGGIVAVLTSILLGVLAVPNMIIAKRPDAKQLIDKIAPFQGWIGAIACLWGAWNIISLVLNISFIIALLTTPVFPMIFAISIILYAVILFALGLLLGIGTMKTFIKNPQAQAKMDQLLAKIAPYQGILGIIAIINGIVLLVFMLGIFKLA
jgi:hypothetical protein